MSTLPFIFNNKFKGFLLIIPLILLSVIPGATQDLSPSAQEQIKSLLEEKASRTVDQRKINSQIWYAYKMDNGQRISTAVASLETGIKKDAQGRIKTNITADISSELLRLLEAEGCEVTSSFSQYKNITALVPLNRIEEIAKMAAIQSIGLWIPPVHNSNPADRLETASNNYSSNYFNSETKEGRPTPLREDNNPKFDKKNILDNLKNSLSSAMIGSLTSEGDVTHQADLVRTTYNVDGTGIKIGVLSDSYDTRPTGPDAIDDVLSGDLPGVGNPNGYLTPVTVLSDFTGANASDEGRAMLQIIHDLVPGAELYFASAFFGRADFAARILELHAAGCDIIVDDVGYLLTPVFQDGVVAGAINTITASGALYFSSAGNSGNLNDGTSGVWEGDFLDGGSLPLFPGGTLHNFDNGQLYNTIALNRPNSITTLKWSEAQGLSIADYDLFITDAAGNNIIGSSTDIQDGDDLPVEFISGNRLAGERIYVLKKNGSTVKALALNTHRGRLGIGTQGQTFGHNAAANTITVAATNALTAFPNIFSSSNVVETFSSDGPRRMFFNPDGSEITPGNTLFGTNGGAVLQKPDITAADGVQTSVQGFNPFFGTSAAAPHAAALAALVKDVLPSYTNAQVKDLLFNNTIDIETPGVDRDAGRGIIMPLDAIAALGFSLDTSFVSESNSIYNNANGALEPGEVGHYNFTISKDPNTAALTNVTMTLTANTPGITMINNTINVASISGSYTSTIGFRFATTQLLDCSTELDFTLTVTYNNGPNSPQIFQDSSTILGRYIGAISGTLGTAPPTGADFTSGSGLQFGRLVRVTNSGGLLSLGNSNCIDGPSSPLSRRSIFQLFEYHIFTFENQVTSDTTCINVNWTVPQAQIYDVYFIAYNQNGYSSVAPENNVIGHDRAFAGALTTNTFSFKVPPGENFTIFVGPDDFGNYGGAGIEYEFSIEQGQCADVPCVATDPMVLSPESHVIGVDKFTGTVGVPFSQTFSATGGSNFDDFVALNIPPGLTFTENSITATLSGIPTAPFGTPPNGDGWEVAAADGLGCADGDVNIYYIQIDPCVPVSIPIAVTSNTPCVGETLNLNVSPSGQAPFTYQWSGPGGTFTNGDTANPSVLNPVNGTYSVTVTNYCGSEVSSTTVVLNTPPVINISGPLNIGTDPGFCTATIPDPVPLFPLVSASGSPAPAISFNYNPQTQFPIGLSTITASATNICGSAQAPIDIIVSDTEAPTAICKSFNIELNNGTTFVFPEDINDGSFDACSSIAMGINGDSSIELVSDEVGFHPVTLNVSDIDGNQATCETVVYVIKDFCLEGNDGIDSDNGGLPDACDCYPNDNFNDKIILDNAKNPGMDFDGTDDYITIANNPDLIPSTGNAMTFEAWIKPDEVTGTQAIATSGTSLTSYNFNIYLSNDNLIASARGNSQLLLALTPIPADVWTHLAVVFTPDLVLPFNSQIEIYINGQFDNELFGPFEATNLGNPILLGDNASADWTYDGELEEVRFWSDPRTASEISIYKDRELSGSEEDLAAYYNFGEGIPEGDNTSLSVIQDYTTNAFDGSLVGFAQTGLQSNWINTKDDLQLVELLRDTLAPCYDCPENLGIAIDYDGVDDFIVIPNKDELIPSNNNSMTFEAWINPEEVSGFQAIATSADVGTLSTYHFAINLQNDKVRVITLTSSLVVSNASIPPNAWTHIAVVFTAHPTTPSLSTTEIYINGVSDNLVTGSFQAGNFGYPIMLGNIDEFNLPYNGQMDEVRFWSDARTATEITDNQNNELYGGEENLVAYYNFNNGIANGANTNLTAVPDMSNNDYEGVLNGFAKSGSSSNWVDNNLTYSTALNSALAFDGVDDHVIIPYDPELVATSSNALTIEAWIYPEKPTGISMIYSSGVFPNLDHQMFLSDDQLILTGNGLNSLIATESIPTFEWTHIAVVYDLTETRLYINGKLDNTRVQILSGTDQGFNTSLGNQANGLPASWNFLGKMDDVRFWDHARTESQIKEKFLAELSGVESGLAAYYSFNNGLPNGNNAGLSITPDYSGEGNEATVFNFLRTGGVSNWVTSPFRFADFDNDGTQDYCDNCVALKKLFLENQVLDGIYRAEEDITLGSGLTIPANANLSLRSPLVIVPNPITVPASTAIEIEAFGCEN